MSAEQLGFMNGCSAWGTLDLLQVRSYDCGGLCSMSRAIRQRSIMPSQKMMATYYPEYLSSKNHLSKSVYQNKLCNWQPRLVFWDNLAQVETTLSRKMEELAKPGWVSQETDPERMRKKKTHWWSIGQIHRWSTGNTIKQIGEDLLSKEKESVYEFKNLVENIGRQLWAQALCRYNKGIRHRCLCGICISTFIEAVPTGFTRSRHSIFQRNGRQFQHFTDMIFSWTTPWHLSGYDRIWGKGLSLPTATILVVLGGRTDHFTYYVPHGFSKKEPIAWSSWYRRVTKRHFNLFNNLHSKEVKGKTLRSIVGCRIDGRLTRAGSQSLTTKLNVSSYHGDRWWSRSKWYWKSGLKTPPGVKLQVCQSQRLVKISWLENMIANDFIVARAWRFFRLIEAGVQLETLNVGNMSHLMRWRDYPLDQCGDADGKTLTKSTKRCEDYVSDGANDTAEEFYEVIKAKKILGGNCHDTMVAILPFTLYSEAYQICDELTIVSISRITSLAGFITGLPRDLKRRTKT